MPRNLSVIVAFLGAAVGFRASAESVTPAADGAVAASLAAATEPASAADAVVIPAYDRLPGLLDFIPNAISDIPHFLAGANPIENWRAYALIAGSSALLIRFDPEILAESQRFARRVRLIDDDDKGGGSRVVWTRKIFGIDADLRAPEGPNAYLYYIGDGITSISIGAGLFGYGLMNADARALNAVSQLAEVIALTGVFVVTSKYSFGRESPFRATERGGAWRPMPGPRNYLRAVSRYDAFPSGHIATVTATTTILARNYPEKAWVVPTGCAAGTLLMFSMLNNGVHWAGDYPLGIAIGYLAANTVFSLRGPAAVTGGLGSGSPAPVNVTVSPFLAPDYAGVALNVAL